MDMLQFGNIYPPFLPFSTPFAPFLTSGLVIAVTCPVLPSICHSKSIDHVFLQHLTVVIQCT